MFDLFDILSYVIIIGFEFVALCAMTRGGRSWSWRLFGFLTLVGVDVLMEILLRLLRMTDELWIATFFVLGWCVMSALIVGLSLDSLGRRLFLAIVYGVCATSYASVYNLLAYRGDGEFGRDVLGLPDVGALAIALGAVVVLNVLFLVWVLPQMPRDDRNFNWRTPCLIAGAILLLLFACGVWPVSIVTAPVRFCVPFVLLSAAAWVGFPMLCRTMREHERRIAAEQNAALMMSEVKVRRAALDEARRIRHDRRHHLIVLGNLLVRGRSKEALEYVSSLDEGTELCAAAHVWCANETINAVLAGYARKAAEKGVAFAAEAHVERTAPLPDAELVAVVANLVENAIDEVERKLKLEVEVKKRNCAGFDSAGQFVDATSSSRQNKDGASSDRRDGDVASTKERDHHCTHTPNTYTSCSPQVTCALRQRGALFGLTVTNDVPPDFRLSRNGLPCAEPGVGLESVRQIVERYSGEWAYTLADGRLTCELALCGGGRT